MTPTTIRVRFRRAGGHIDVTFWTGVPEYTFACVGTLTMSSEPYDPLEDTMTRTIEPRYPEIEVELSGEDGNAFAILGRVSAAIKTYLRDEGLNPGERMAIANQFTTEATAGDYDNLLLTCHRWVSVR
jgi:hypothetical protein